MGVLETVQAFNPELFMLRFCRTFMTEVRIYLQVSMNDFLLMAILYCGNNLKRKSCFNIGYKEYITTFIMKHEIMK
jgi:hypothetical protein